MITFLSSVLSGLAAETDIGLVQQVLMQCRSAIDVYADRKNRITYNTKFADGIQNLLAQAENGSDRQLALVRTFSAVATTEAQINRVAAILDGKESLVVTSVQAISFASSVGIAARAPAACSLPMAVSSRFNSSSIASKPRFPVTTNLRSSVQRRSVSISIFLQLRNYGILEHMKLVNHLQQH